MKTLFPKKTTWTLVFFLAIAGLYLFYQSGDVNIPHKFRFWQKKHEVAQYDEKKHFDDLVKLINDNHFFMSESRDFTAEQALIRKAPGGVLNPQNPAEFFVVEQNTKAVGMIALQKKNLQEGYIWLLVVDNAHRGQGIARSLLSFALDNFKNRGLKYATISVKTLNKPAIKLYESFGFEVFETFQDRGILTLKKTF